MDQCACSSRMLVQLARENPTTIASLVSPRGQRGLTICGHCAQDLASLLPLSVRSGVDAGSASANTRVTSCRSPF